MEEECKCGKHLAQVIGHHLLRFLCQLIIIILFLGRESFTKVLQITMIKDNTLMLREVKIYVYPLLIHLLDYTKDFK
jgi:hypothetical protein